MNIKILIIIIKLHNIPIVGGKPEISDKNIRKMLNNGLKKCKSILEIQDLGNYTKTYR